MTTRKLVTMALLISLAIVVSIADSFIPSFVPGMKLGLANIIILVTLYGYGFKEAFLVNLARVFIASLLRGNIFTMGFFMSLAGAIASLIVMFLLKRFIKNIHIVGVSVVGSLFHSAAQIVVGMFFISSTSLIYYLPILCLTSVITGIFVGLTAGVINKKNLLKNGDLK